MDLGDPQLADAGSAAALELALNFSRSPLALLTVVMGWLFATDIQVNQSFLGFIALLEGLTPIATIQRASPWCGDSGGRCSAVDPAGGDPAPRGVGLCGLAAAPVCVCITGAAYRQLFGKEDPAGLLEDRIECGSATTRSGEMSDQSTRTYVSSMFRSNKADAA